jgi:hypothetical protein
MKIKTAVSHFRTFHHKKKLPSPGTRLKHGAKRREKVSWKEKELVDVQKLSERVFAIFILINEVFHSQTAFGVKT